MSDVDVLISDARGYAAAAVPPAEALVGQATAAISQLGAPFAIVGPKFADQPQVVFPDAVPEFSVQAFDPGSAPDAPGPNDLVNVPTLDAGTAPTLTAVDPGYVDPRQPSQLADFTGVAPAIQTSFQFPDVPAALQNINVQPPDLPDRAEPAVPSYVVPTFDVQAPSDIPDAPNDYDTKFVKAYRDVAPTMVAALDGQMDAMLRRYNPRFFEQLNRLEGKLATYIDGGSALTPAIENAILARTNDKLNGDFRRVRDTAYQDAARRGFTIPDGMLNSNVQQARQGAADNLARAANELAIKQAELEQQNIQFAITTTTQLRTAVLSTMLSYHGNLVSLNGQAIQYAQAVLNAAVQIYDSMVKAYSARLEAYKAEAMVFETRMQAVQLLVEIYKGEVTALEALSRVDQSKIELYRSRIDALNTLARVYQSQIEVVQSQANIEKTKIELFGAQVQAYATQAQAKSAEWQGYSAAVGGQEARIRAYETRIRAYGAEVDAWKSTIEAKTAQIESYARFNENKLRIYAANVEGYKTVVGAKATVAQTLLENQRVKLMSYSAKVSASEAQARLAQQYYSTRATIADSQFRTVAQVALQSAELNTKQIEAVAQTSLSGADVYARIAQSALQGMNTLVTSQTTTSA